MVFKHCFTIILMVLYVDQLFKALSQDHCLPGA